MQNYDEQEDILSALLSAMLFFAALEEFKLGYVPKPQFVRQDPFFLESPQPLFNTHKTSTRLVPQLQLSFSHYCSGVHHADHGKCAAAYLSYPFTYYRIL